MPSYITKLVNTVGGICCPNTFSKDSSKFFSSLATKLLEMTTAINKRIDDIKKNCKSSSGGGGVLLASIDAPQMTLGVKYEYIEYIKRFGPPTDGIFDEKKLEDLRIELGISTTNNL